MHTAHPMWWLVGGASLFHFLWAGALLGMLAWSVRSFVPARALTVRYLLAGACLAALAGMPVLLAWRITTQLQAPAFAMHADVPEEIPDIARLTDRTRGAASPALPAVAPPASPGWFDVGMAWALSRCAGWLWVAWGVGAATLLAGLLRGVYRSRRLRAGAIPLHHGPTVKRCGELARRLGVRTVPVSLSSAIESPLLVGVLHPTILLPHFLCVNWSTEDVELVLLHELTHVRRRDNLINLLQSAVECLLWFHPAVWMSSRWLRQDREDYCDSIVIRETRRPLEYAELLTQLASQPRPLRIAVAMGEHNLVGRVRRILQRPEPRPRHWARAVILLVTLGAAMPALAHVYALGLPVPDISPPVSTASPVPPVAGPGPVGAAPAVGSWRVSSSSGGELRIRVVDGSGVPAAGAMMHVKPRWRNQKLLDDARPLVADAEGVIRVRDSHLLHSGASCDPYVPVYVTDAKGTGGALLNLTEKDWNTQRRVSLAPLVRVRFQVLCEKPTLSGRALTWKKFFISLPENQIQYHLRQTGDGQDSYEALLPPGRYRALAFAGSEEAIETDTSAILFDVPDGLVEMDAGVIQLVPKAPKPLPARPRSSLSTSAAQE